MAHRQKEVVITQQLTSFNYSKRARSFHLYWSIKRNGCKTQLSTFVLVGIFSFCSDIVELCVHVFVHFFFIYIQMFDLDWNLAPCTIVTNYRIAMPQLYYPTATLLVCHSILFFLYHRWNCALKNVFFLHNNNNNKVRYIHYQNQRKRSPHQTEMFILVLALDWAYREKKKN